MNFNRPPTTTALAAGSWLDRYELLAPIAEGGFGQVWLARLRGKRGFEKLVAIKVPRVSADVHFQEMLLDEARIAAAIEHDNVARILELGEQEDLLYIVMEWIDGEPLSSLLRTLEKNKIPLPLPIALKIICDMCLAAHAAHELRGADGGLLNVVHRDISPQNMLITSTGTVKLIDFGIAKARDRAAGETTDGTLKGKIKYMAPEQALGGAVDRRADIFALGAVLHRLLSGRAPYEGENEVATLHHLARGGAPHPLPANVPREIRGVVNKALALAASARFETALEMYEALQNAMLVLELVVSTADVARFTEQHMKERIQARREAVDAALKAAAARALTSSEAALLAGAPISSSSGMLSPPSSPSGGDSSNSNSGHSNSNSNSASNTYSNSANSATGPSLESGRMFALDVGGGAPPPSESFSHAGSRRLRWLWAAAVGVGVLGVLLILVAVRGRDGASQKATASPPASASSDELPAAIPSGSESLPPAPPTATAAATPSASASAAPPATSLARKAPPSPPPPPPVAPKAPVKKPGKPATADFGY